MMKKFDKIICFTDGSCSKNGKVGAKAGIGIYYPCKEFTDVGEPFTLSPITNQRAELYAIYHALDTVTKECQFNKLFIYTDSLYSIKCVTIWINNWEKNGWKGTNKQDVKNSDIIKMISAIMKQHEGKIIFTHVKGHAKDDKIESIFNSRADELACKGTIKSK